MHSVLNFQHFSYFCRAQANLKLKQGLTFFWANPTIPNQTFTLPNPPGNFFSQLQLTKYVFAAYVTIVAASVKARYTKVSYTKQAGS